MATVDIGASDLTIHITGIDRILAFKSSITVPLAHVVGVERDVAAASAIYHGLKLPGTSLPGVITAGSYLKSGEWSFWDVHDPRKALIIRLRDEHYGKLVVGVDAPEETARMIEQALGQQRP